MNQQEVQVAAKPKIENMLYFPFLLKFYSKLL